MRSRKCVSTLLLFLSVLAITAIAGMQGLCMADEGWVLTGYQQIFSDPTSVQYLFLYYLSLVAGGCWYLLSGHCGIMGFRLLGALMVAASMAIAYWFLQGKVGRRAVVGGCIILLCMHADEGFFYFDHDQLSALLSLLGGIMLYRGAARSSQRWMLLGGMVMGINIFVRIPNIALLGCLLVLVAAGCYDGWRKAAALLPPFVCGLLAGAAMVVLLMLVLGHLPIFLQTFADAISAGSDIDSTHNIGYLLRIYAANYRQMLIAMLLLFAAPCALVAVSRRLGSLWIAAGIGIVVLVATMPPLLRRLHDAATVNAFATAILLTAIYVYKRSRPTVLLATIALTMMHAQCIGGDFGFYNMEQNSLYLAVPYAAGLCWSFIKRIDNRHVRSIVKLYAGILLLLYLAESGMKFEAHNTYYEHHPRTAMRHRAHHRLADTYVAGETAAHLDSLLAAMKPYVAPGDRLLCIENTPMIHFLTQTLPYLQNPWTWSYDPSNLQLHLERALRDSPQLPVVVISKGKGQQWEQPDPDWNNLNVPDDYIYKHRRRQQYLRFIRQNHYRKAWESPLFLLLLPPERRIICKITDKSTGI